MTLRSLFRRNNQEDDGPPAPSPPRQHRRKIVKPSHARPAPLPLRIPNARGHSMVPVGYLHMHGKTPDTAYATLTYHTKRGMAIYRFVSYRCIQEDFDH